jgi:ABC-type lipoprotein export system ATPase subunit
VATPFIQVNSLSKTYPTPAGPLTVLKDVTLNLEAGDFAVLVGPSGSGKTTFLNMLTAIDTPTAGEVTIGSVNVTRTPQRELIKWRARNIGIVFQFFQLLPTVSVVQNVIAPMDLARVHQPGERTDRAMALLERLGIADQAHKLPATLSGGEQQRVAIARALANDPPLLIGDELTANLDRMSAANVFDILRELAEGGTTALVVSYDRELMTDVPKLFELHNSTIQSTALNGAASHRTHVGDHAHIAHLIAAANPLGKSSPKNPLTPDHRRR